MALSRLGTPVDFIARQAQGSEICDTQGTRAKTYVVRQSRTFAKPYTARVIANGAAPKDSIYLGVGLSLAALLLAAPISLLWVCVSAAYAQQSHRAPGYSSTSSSEVLGVAVVPVPAYGRAPLSVAFSARVSGVQNVGNVSYQWNFGDGSALVAPPQLVTHTYQQPGSYIVTAIVTTADGRSAAGSAGVIVTP
jgi:hypothetical protein